jgi:hypothetical protein
MKQHCINCYQFLENYPIGAWSEVTMAYWLIGHGRDLPSGQQVPAFMRASQSVPRFAQAAPGSALNMRRA